MIKKGLFMQRVVTLTNDFGDNFATSQMELVVFGINPDAKFILVSNEVTPYSILEGAFIVRQAYQFSPKGSVHIAIIDPGVGSARRGLIIKSKNYWFVGPDNGVLYPAAADDGIEAVYQIDEAIVNPNSSTTFHGRDVFAKVAARLSNNEDPNTFAKQIEPASIITFEFQENQIVHIDPYGNIKLSSHLADVKPGDVLKVTYQDKTWDIPYCKTFADVATGQLLAYLGSHNTLEIAQNLGDGAKILNAQVGDIISITKQ